MKANSKEQEETPHLTMVVTTIQSPMACMRAWSQLLKRLGCPILVIGDKTGPTTYPLSGTELVTFEQQLRLSFHLAKLLPAGRYSRKNLGYLLAIHRHAECIYETDDDNAPMKSWEPRQLEVPALVHKAKRWVNVYRQYSHERVWPRGLPLNLIHERPNPEGKSPVTLEAPVQQGLANGSPDVDAVWRLVLDKPIQFDAGPSLALSIRAWCPFNSQSTWWWPEAYRLLYLPSHCSFRMTDIWRSFVAQRCLWALGRKLVFHPAEVLQVRNDHDLMHDFKDEIPGYLMNETIRKTLDLLNLKTGRAYVGENLLCCYESLVAQGIFPKQELLLLRAWLTDTAALEEPLKNTGAEFRTCTKYVDHSPRPQEIVPKCVCGTSQ